jgi:hypothetical protein
VVEALHLAFVGEVRLTETQFRDERLERARAPGALLPYEAELAIAEHDLPESLRAHARRLGVDRCRVHFDARDALLGALLARPAVFRVVRPRWLADRLRARLTRLLEQNVSAASGGTSCVPPGGTGSHAEPQRPPSGGDPS